MTTDTSACPPSPVDTIISALFPVTDDTLPEQAALLADVRAMTIATSGRIAVATPKRLPGPMRQRAKIIAVDVATEMATQAESQVHVVVCPSLSLIQQMCDEMILTLGSLPGVGASNVSGGVPFATIVVRQNERAAVVSFVPSFRVSEWLGFCKNADTVYIAVQERFGVQASGQITEETFVDTMIKAGRRVVVCTTPAPNSAAEALDEYQSLHPPAINS